MGTPFVGDAVDFYFSGIEILNQGLQINGNAGRAIKWRIHEAIALLENEID